MAFTLPRATAFLVLAAAGLFLTSLPNPAQAQGAPKPAVKWQYCHLAVGNSGNSTCLFITAKETIFVQNLKELADKLAVPKKDREGKDGYHLLIVMMDFLGAQGWELVSRSVSGEGGSNSDLVFKRRVE